MIRKVISDLEEIVESDGTIEDVRDYVIETLVDFFELPKINEENYPQIVLDYSELDFEIKQFSKESHYNVEHNFIFYAPGNFDALAEESMHFINYFFNETTGQKFNYGSGIDYFYSHVLAEALGHFASKLVFGMKFDEERIKGTEAYDLYLEHLKFESNIKGLTSENFNQNCPLEKIFKQDIKEISSTLHFLGYNLGEKMFKAYEEKRFFKKELRDLIYNDFKEKGSSMDIYLSLVEFLE